MSLENIEIVKAGFAGFESGQFFELLDPEIEWDARRDLPDSAIYRGHVRAPAPWALLRGDG
jgi:hypothetical protein